MGIDCVCGSTIGHIFNPRCYSALSSDSFEVIGPYIRGGQSDMVLHSVSFRVRGEHRDFVRHLVDVDVYAPQELQEKVVEVCANWCLDLHSRIYALCFANLVPILWNSNLFPIAVKLGA